MPLPLPLCALRGLRLFPWYFCPCAGKAPAAAFSANLPGFLPDRCGLRPSGSLPVLVAAAAPVHLVPAAARIAAGASCSGCRFLVSGLLQLRGVNPNNKPAPPGSVRGFGLFAAAFFAAAARIASGLVKITRTITNFPAAGASCPGCRCLVPDRLQLPAWFTWYQLPAPDRAGCRCLVHL